MTKQCKNIKRNGKEKCVPAESEESLSATQKSCKGDGSEVEASENAKAQRATVTR